VTVQLLPVTYLKCDATEQLSTFAVKYKLRFNTQAKIQKNPWQTDTRDKEGFELNTT
jgi:hypothetical protein